MNRFARAFLVVALVMLSCLGSYGAGSTPISGLKLTGPADGGGNNFTNLGTVACGTATVSFITLGTNTPINNWSQAISAGGGLTNGSSGVSFASLSVSANATNGTQAVNYQTMTGYVASVAGNFLTNIPSYYVTNNQSGVNFASLTVAFNATGNTQVVNYQTMTQYVASVVSASSISNWNFAYAWATNDLFQDTNTVNAILAQRGFLTTNFIVWSGSFSGDLSVTNNWVGGKVPKSGDTAVFDSTLVPVMNQPSIGTLTCGLAVFNGGVSLNGGTVKSDVIFRGSISLNSATINGNVLFEDTTSMSSGTINGNVVLASTGPQFLSGTINGHVDFRGTDVYNSTAIITGDCLFSGLTSHMLGGTINGNCFFAGGSSYVSGGSINGNCVFLGSSSYAQSLAISGNCVLLGSSAQLRLCTVFGNVDLAGTSSAAMVGSTINGNLNLIGSSSSLQSGALCKGNIVKLGTAPSVAGTYYGSISVADLSAVNRVLDGNGGILINWFAIYGTNYGTPLSRIVANGNQAGGDIGFGGFNSITNIFSIIGGSSFVIRDNDGKTGISLSGTARSLVGTNGTSVNAYWDQGTWLGTAFTATGGQQVVNYQTMTGYVASVANISPLSGVLAVGRDSGTNFITFAGGEWKIDFDSVVNGWARFATKAGASGATVILYTNGATASQGGNLYLQAGDDSVSGKVLVRTGNGVRWFTDYNGDTFFGRTATISPVLMITNDRVLVTQTATNINEVVNYQTMTGFVGNATPNLQQVVSVGGTVTSGVVTIDAANLRTNIVGGYLTKLGTRITQGSGTANGYGSIALGYGGITANYDGDFVFCDGTSSGDATMPNQFMVSAKSNVVFKTDLFQIGRYGDLGVAVEYFSVTPDGFAHANSNAVSGTQVVNYQTMTGYVASVTGNFLTNIPSYYVTNNQSGVNFASLTVAFNATGDTQVVNYQTMTQYVASVGVGITNGQPNVTLGTNFALAGAIDVRGVADSFVQGDWIVGTDVHITNSAGTLSIGASNDNQSAKLYVKGDNGTLTNRPLVLIEGSTGRATDFFCITAQGGTVTNTQVDVSGNFINRTNMYANGFLVATIDSLTMPTNIPVVLGTGTVRRAMGDTCFLTMTTNTTLTFNSADWTTNGIGRVTVDVVGGPYSFTLDTNTITGTATVPTNGTTPLFFRKHYQTTTWKVSQ